MSRPPRRRWWALGLAVAPAVPIGWLVFVADGWTINRLVVDIWSRAVALGADLTPEQTDGVLNTLMLLPSAFFASLWLPRVRWWVWVALGAGASVAIETVQYFTDRDASGHDLAFNTLGAALGALAGAAVNRAAADGSGLVERPVGVLRKEPGGNHRHAEHHAEEGEERGAAEAGHDPRDQ